MQNIIIELSYEHQKELCTTFNDNNDMVKESARGCQTRYLS